MEQGLTHFVDLFTRSRASVPVPDELRDPTVVLTRFRLAVRSMLDLPLQKTEADLEAGLPSRSNCGPADCALDVNDGVYRHASGRQREHLRMLRNTLRVAFPVSDAGSFASLLSQLDTHEST